MSEPKVVVFVCVDGVIVQPARGWDVEEEIIEAASMALWLRREKPDAVVTLLFDEEESS